jgi:hypothetical protein
MAKQGCFGCDEDLTSKITIEGKQYSSVAEKADEYETSVEGTSGYMINNKKKVTVFVYFDQDKALPFPALDGIGKQLIPLYDMSEQLSINIGQVS